MASRFFSYSAFVLYLAGSWIYYYLLILYIHSPAFAGELRKTLSAAPLCGFSNAGFYEQTRESSCSSSLFFQFRRIVLIRASGDSPFDSLTMLRAPCSERCFPIRRSLDYRLLMGLKLIEEYEPFMGSMYDPGDLLLDSCSPSIPFAIEPVSTP